MGEYLTETGQIVAVSEGRAEVQVRRFAACSGCHNRGDCGVDSVNTALGARQGKVFSVEADNPDALPVGSWVEVALPAQQLLQLSLRTYLWPIALLLLGAMLGAQSGSELYSILGAGAGFGLGLAWLRGFAQRQNPQLGHAVIRRVLARDRQISQYPA